jgi:hypothetical protein
MAEAIAPVPQVIATPEDDVDPESVRKCGPLAFGSAVAYARAIPSDRRSVTGFYKIKCPGGCCIGCTYNVDCNGCLCTPTCILLPGLTCFNSDGDGGWYTQRCGLKGEGAPKEYFLYEVDSESHTLACYSFQCMDPMSISGPKTPCLYCVK